MIEYIIETIRTNDILFNIYKDIYKTIKNCEDIENLMVFYLKIILYIIYSNKYKNKHQCISKILEKIYNELNIIYITYNEDYDEEMEKIRKISLKLKNIKDNEDIINNNVKKLKSIFSIS